MADRMCGRKYAYPTEKSARKNAENFGQRVYKCPVCFCWHCTSLENWKHEYITVTKHETLIQQEKAIANKKIKVLKQRVFLLERQLKIPHDEAMNWGKLKRFLKASVGVA